MIKTNRSTCSWLVTLLVLVAIGLACPATAYEVLLDIDLDGDPTTINEYTEDESCTVRIVLAPTEPDEQIDSIYFGLGGSCLECQGVHHYGVSHDLYPPDYGDWTEVPGFVGGWDGILLLGCPGPVGSHTFYWAEPLLGQITLSSPIFLATFQAEVAPPPPSGCQPTPANLGATHGQGLLWNYIQIGGPAVRSEQRTWGTLKQLFR